MLCAFEIGREINQQEFLYEQSKVAMGKDRFNLGHLPFEPRELFLHSSMQPFSFHRLFFFFFMTTLSLFGHYFRGCTRKIMEMKLNPVSQICNSLVALDFNGGGVGVGGGIQITCLKMSLSN